MNIRRTLFRCRCCAVFSLLAVSSLAIACDGRSDAPHIDDSQHMPVSDLADELLSTPMAGHTQWAVRYYNGYLAEVLHGRMDEARAAYAAVIAEAGSQEPELAARAALRLAELKALAGERREAIELMARASVLGRDHLDIVEQADRLHARLGSLRADGREVRGPPLGTDIEEIGEQIHQRFRAAERLQAAYQRIRLQPRLEKLKAGVRTKEHAMNTAVRAYQQVTTASEPAVRIAAEFRIASLYHDLALSLMFDLPPELEPRAAAKLKKSLRTSAFGHLQKARTAYSRSLELQNRYPRQAHSERWSAAAALGLRSVEDLLGGR